MPNSRRRRFSVHNGIASRERELSKIQNTGVQSSAPTNDLETKTFTESANSYKSINKMLPSSSRNSQNLGITSHCDSNSVKTNKFCNVKTDKNVTASSSNINLLTSSKNTDYQSDTEKAGGQSKKVRPITHEGLSRNKHPHQHRMKVRSPRRRANIPPLIPTKAEPKNLEPKEKDSMVTTGTEAINWSKEVEVCVDNSGHIETTEDDERQSDHSLDDMCRICHGGDSLTSELGPLISACACRGTVGRVHVKCLERWLTESGKSRCELCGMRYATRRVHRYGVPRALVMWILSQNAKQLMVDSLGIMLMSPLAVLAAWLSGRTLAGLMMQDSRGTPWPLASTFVLACMTLVCYYCWIVSAATRHALGWWIWYRSQYEVRLTLESEE